MVWEERDGDGQASWQSSLTLTAFNDSIIPQNAETGWHRSSCLHICISFSLKERVRPAGFASCEPGPVAKREGESIVFQAVQLPHDQVWKLILVCLDLSSLMMFEVDVDIGMNLVDI